MKTPTPWQLFWEECDAAMYRYSEAQAESTNEFIKQVRMAVTRYGEELDPDSFDELGQPIIPEEGER